MNFLAELRRRSVFRVTAAYLVAAWVVMQVIGFVADASTLPEWTTTFILILVIAGLPIVIIVAWAFELTPEGPKLTGPREVDEEVKPFSAADAILIGAVVVVVGVIVWQQLAPRDVQYVEAESIDEVPHGPEAASIAVLAFEDLSPEGDQEYFSDGISEELLNVLVRVDGLRVASRTSAFRFKGSNASIPEIAEDLQVRHVLEGSVRRAGDTIRITAQLIDSDNDGHLWSETYDRELTASNVFAVQDEIATAIVAALSEQLGDILPGTEIDVQARTENLTAYELFLRARSLFLAREDMGLADLHLAQAVELDPSFAEAWELRGAVYYLGVQYGGIDGTPEELMALSVEYSERALALDEDSALAITVIANAASSLVADPDADLIARTIADYTRALEIDPLNTTTLNWRGLLLGQLGYIEQAIADFDRCIEIEPYYRACRGNIAAFAPGIGEDQRAVEEFIEISNQGQELNIYPFGALARLGERDLFVVLASAEYGSTAPWGDHDNLLEIMLNPDGDYSHLIDDIIEFETARETYTFPYGGVEVLLGNYERFDGFGFWPPGPLLQGYRQSEIFQQRLQAGPLPDYWRAHGFPPQCRERDDGRIECD